MEKVLEFCLRCADVSQKAAECPESNEEQKNVNIGAALAFLAVAELIEKEMKE